MDTWTSRAPVAAQAAATLRVPVPLTAVAAASSASARSTLGALRAAGVPVAVVSNIGFDIRPLAADLGIGDLLDEYVLSYEVGRCKPDPAIFRKACALLRADPERTLMVGDTPADAGAAGAGCSVLVLPESEPGAVHGLGAILRLL